MGVNGLNRMQNASLFSSGAHVEAGFLPYIYKQETLFTFCISTMPEFHAPNNVNYDELIFVKYTVSN
jgi:hypothetical protein